MEYLLVFIGAALPFVEIMVVIPIGIIAGLSPFLVIMIAFAGNMITVLLLIIGYQKLKEWRAKKKNAKDSTLSKRSERGKRIWNKYGMPGLAMLGPIVIGSHLAAFIAMTFGATKTNTTIWMTISVAIWALIFGILTEMGFVFFVET